MTDFNIVGCWMCETNEHWETIVAGSKGDAYTVRWGLRIDACGYGYSCTCRGFQYHGKCRHIVQVAAEKRRCGWNHTMEPTCQPDRNENNEPICPECGGPVISVRVAV